MNAITLDRNLRIKIPSTTLYLIDEHNTFSSEDDFKKYQIHLLKEALKTRGFKLSNGSLWDLIDNEMIIEAYWLVNFKQMLCNLNFIKKTNYTVDEIYSSSFSDLFHRDEKHLEQIKIEINRAIAENNYIKPNIEDHVIYETKTKEQQKFLIKTEYYCPVLDENNVAVAIFSVVSVEAL